VVERGERLEPRRDEFGMSHRTTVQGGSRPFRGDSPDAGEPEPVSTMTGP
jgi:hypothetical protein